MEKYDVRIQDCGNCEFHKEVWSDLFCGLDPQIICKYGHLKKNGVRRFLLDYVFSKIPGGISMVEKPVDEVCP